jgi:hypothetical protein
MHSIALANPPSYNIYDIGIIGSTDSGSQSFDVSDNGIVTGRSLGNPTRAFTWTEAGGRVTLNNLVSPVRNFSVGNGVNKFGVVVGTGSTTTFGSSPLPIQWNGTTVTALPMPAGQTSGRANDINNNGLVIGSVNGGSLEAGFMVNGTTASLLNLTGPGGTFFRTPFAVNDDGITVGFGIDPLNAARNVGLVYRTASGVVSEVGALSASNGALCFDISNTRFVTGSSMQNQGSGLPFIANLDSNTINPIPLPADSSQGSGRGVNSWGWTVGNSSSAFSVPWLNDGINTYKLQDLIPPASGWDLSANTSASALGVSEGGIIVGTGVKSGLTRAYAMVPANLCGVIPKVTISFVPNAEVLAGKPLTITPVSAVNDPLTMVLSGGGYGGHVYPAVTISFLAHASIPTSLKRLVTIPATAAGQAAFLDINLINGNAENSDNEIGPGDLQVILDNFGETNFNPNADLDFDGEVGPGDLQIVLDNFGLEGD